MNKGSRRRLWASPGFIPTPTRSWHLYVVRSKARDALRSRLDAQGIGSLIHYPLPPHLQGAYRSMGAPRGRYPIAEALADEVLSLPMGPHLSDDDVARVIDACGGTPRRR